MAAPTQPTPVKLIAGLLAGHIAWLDAATEVLTERYGPADIIGEVIDFDFTDYYCKQMGPNLLRQFLAFERLIHPGELAAIKLATNDMEADLAERLGGEVPRPVNIDPGYVQSAKLVLASAKDFAHRVYLADGIYGEVTLQYRHRRWESSAWTFPDYGSGRYDGFLNAARQRLKEQLA